MPAFKISIAILTIAFIAMAAAKRPPMLTVEQQQHEAEQWAKRVGLPVPPPPVPPKSCLSPPCAKQRQAVQQYWEQHLLADLKQNVSKDEQLPPPPSDASDVKAWHRYFGRFADVYQPDYPIAPKMSDKQQWHTYWVQMLRFGRHWPSHPPPAKLGNDYKKGYDAWVAAFKQCHGASCEGKKDTAGIGKRIGRFVKQTGEKVKKALGMQSKHEEDASHIEAASATPNVHPSTGGMSYSGSKSITGMSNHPEMQGSPSSAGYHPHSQGAGQPSYSAGQTGFNQQQAASYSGQPYQGVGQGGFGQQAQTGSFPGQSYNPLASRQSQATSPAGGRNASYSVQRSMTYGGGGGSSQGGYYPSPAHGQQQNYNVQRGYGESQPGGYPRQQPYGQASFDFQRSSNYNPQQQGYHDSVQGGSYNATRSMQYMPPPPRGQYKPPSSSYNVERSMDYFPSQSPMPPPRSAAASSYPRQSQQAQFQPDQPVFHGHHSTLGPVWRSPASNQALLHGGQQLKYYIERAGMLYEVSAEMFHELRCESGGMKCCAPNCGKSHPPTSQPQQAYPPAGQYSTGASASSRGGSPSPTYQPSSSRRAYQSSSSSPAYQSSSSSPAYQSGSSQGRTSSTAKTTQQQPKSSSGGVWSSFANFWNAPATKKRHFSLYGQQPTNLYPKQVGGYGSQYGQQQQQQGAGVSYDVSRQASYSSGSQLNTPPASASYSANRQYHASSSQSPSLAPYSTSRQVSYGPVTHTTSSSSYSPYAASRSSQYSVSRTASNYPSSASVQGGVSYQQSGGSVGQGGQLGGMQQTQQAPPSSAAYGQQLQRA